MEFVVTESGNQVGTVQIEQIGLYLDIRCCCTGLAPDFYRLMMTVGDKITDLGLLIPDGNHYMSNKKIPNRIPPDSVPVFCLSKSSGAQKGAKVQLLAGQPVETLVRLRTGKLHTEKGAYFLGFNLRDHEALRYPDT